MLPGLQALQQSLLEPAKAGGCRQSWLAHNLIVLQHSCNSHALHAFMAPP